MTDPVEQIQNQDEQAMQDAQPLVFDTWLKEQPENVHALLDAHTHGLRSALDSERAGRKDLEKQLKILAAKAEKGSDLERSLTEMAGKIEESDRRADFYETAHAAGVTNLKLAFIVASQEGLFDSKGRVNFEAMRVDFPELFGSAKPLKPPPGNAGSGTNTQQPGNAGMNEFIRQAAGRTTN